MTTMNEDLRQLKARVVATFGEAAWTNAQDRALVALTKAIPDGLDEGFDGDAAYRAALTVDVQRMLEPQ